MGHIFIAEAFSEPTESDEMVLGWFDVSSIPYEKMWPDIAQWLPQILQEERSAIVRGYFEIFEGRLTESRPLAPGPVLRPKKRKLVLHFDVNETIIVGEPGL